MGKLINYEKETIEREFAKQNINWLERHTPAARWYNGVRYEYKSFKMPPEYTEYEVGYYNPSDDSDILCAGRDIIEQVALSKCLAYLEMIRREQL